MFHQFKLSKLKLLAYRQCPKRLWLQAHHPESLRPRQSNNIRQYEC